MEHRGIVPVLKIMIKMCPTVEWANTIVTRLSPQEPQSRLIASSTAKWPEAAEQTDQLHGKEALRGVLLRSPVHLCVSSQLQSIRDNLQHSV